MGEKVKIFEHGPHNAEELEKRVNKWLEEDRPAEIISRQNVALSGGGVLILVWYRPVK